MSITPRPLHIFGTLWSLRRYPTKSREWSWSKKFAAIATAGCDGLFSAPIPELAERGSLQYLAVASFSRSAPVKAQFRAAKQLGAVAIGIQLGGISPLAPERRGQIAKFALKAMLGGAFASWMTATIAGMFL